MLSAFFQKNGKCRVIFLCVVLLFSGFVPLNAADKKQAINFDYKAETAKNGSVQSAPTPDTARTKTGGNGANGSAANSSLKKTETGTITSDGVFVAFGDSSNATGGDDGGYVKANDNVYMQDSSVVDSVPSVGLSIKIGADTKQKRSISGNNGTVRQPAQYNATAQKKTVARETGNSQNLRQTGYASSATALSPGTEGAPKNGTEKGSQGNAKSTVPVRKIQADTAKAREKQEKRQKHKSLNAAEAEIEKIMAENIAQSKLPDSSYVAKPQEEAEPQQKSAAKTELANSTGLTKAGKTIQFGSYSQRYNAQAAVEKAAKAGVKNARIVTVQQKGKPVYRVQVSTGSTGNDSEAVAERLKKAGFDVYVK